MIKYELWNLIIFLNVFENESFFYLFSNIFKNSKIFKVFESSLAFFGVFVKEIVIFILDSDSLY